MNFVKGRSEQKGDLESPGFASIFTNSAPNKIKNDKSCDLFKLVSVLLSASVERVGVSSMRDFFYILKKRQDTENRLFFHDFVVGVGVGVGTTLFLEPGYTVNETIPYS